MRKLFLVCTMLSLTFISAIKGQDPHFSQYFSSPLTLNPAMTGYFEGDSRVSTNFRQQWVTLGQPFITGTFSYDTKLLQTKIREQDILSAGILGLYDQSSGGGFKNVNLSAAVAYHKALDADGIHRIGVGFQATYASRVIGFSGLDFANQFNGSGFDTNIPSYESLGTTRSSYFDINTGFLYTYKTENTEVYAGGSLYHVGRPNMSFLKNEKFRLPMRYTAHAGSRFVLDENGNELFVGGLYMYQAKATEKTLGIACGIAVNEEVKIYGGSWYRFDDAIIPFLGLTVKGLQAGLTYDVNNSSLKNFSPGNRSFELSLILLVTRPRNVYTNYKGGRIF